MLVIHMLSAATIAFVVPNASELNVTWEWPEIVATLISLAITHVQMHYHRVAFDAFTRGGRRYQRAIANLVVQ